jgi:hypothetical protein
MSTVQDKQLVKKWSSLESSAKSRGIPFNISLKHLAKLLGAKRCFYTGLEFDDNVEELKRSIDRVDSDLGYTDDNTVPCIKRINELKSNLSYKELVWIFQGMGKHFRRRGKDLKVLRGKTLNYERHTIPIPVKTEIPPKTAEVTEIQLVA